ncbi:Hypothetical_protein [Hexamita inflata]|uniref:Hypothetical_protein n=1 Tax=Hexamita inflata TaxID=28002 RepID=A0AA86PYK8_9EUKA|nr:Hypothetical protein HINF_LOCUS36349 [Hexamita inflata]
MNTINLQRVENATRTTLTDKNIESSIYIKMIQCNGDVKVKIIDEKGANNVFYGNYYTLKEGQEYLLLNTLSQQNSKKVMLTFDQKITMEWIPDYINLFSSANSIQEMRFGTYESEYLYDYNISCNLQVAVTSLQGLRFRQEPGIRGNIIQGVRGPQLHEILTITQLSNDFGLTTLNNVTGWICIRYVSILGCEGQCKCFICQQTSKKEFPRFNAQNSIEMQYLCQEAVSLYKSQIAFNLALANLTTVSNFDISEPKQIQNAQWKASDIRTLLKSLVLGNTLNTINWNQTHQKFTSICQSYKACTNQSLRQIVFRQIKNFKKDEYFQKENRFVEFEGKTWSEKLAEVLKDDKWTEDDILACLAMMRLN